MRLELSFSDRVGIASEILTVLAREGLDVVAVEVEPPFIYIDAPDLDAGRFQSVRPALEAVTGVLKLTVMRVTGMARLLRIGAGSSGNVGRNGSTRKNRVWCFTRTRMMLRSKN